jgi:hypothetical protein
VQERVGQRERERNTAWPGSRFGHLAFLYVVAQLAGEARRLPTWITFLDHSAATHGNAVLLIAQCTARSTHKNVFDAARHSPDLLLVEEPCMMSHDVDIYTYEDSS